MLLPQGIPGRDNSGYVMDAESNRRYADNYPASFSIPSSYDIVSEETNHPAVMEYGGKAMRDVFYFKTSPSG